MRYVWHCSRTSVQLFKEFFGFFDIIGIESFLLFTLWGLYSGFIHWHTILLIGLGGENRTPITWSQTTNSTIKLHRENYFTLGS